MKKGCVWGCLGIGALGLLILVIAAFMVDRAFGLFRPIDRVDLAARYGADHPVVARLDLESPFLKDLTQQASGRRPFLVELFWPYEAYLFVDVGPESAEREMGLALSTRRLGGVLSMYLPVPDDWNLGGGMIVRDIKVDSSGVLFLDALGSIAAESVAEAAARWPEAIAEPFALSREHHLEIVVDNSRGKGFLAIESLFRDSIWRDDESVLTDEDRDTLLYSIGALRISADAVNDTTMNWNVVSRCRDEAAAERVLAVLNKWRDGFVKSLAADDATLTGEFTRDGVEIKGDFVASNYKGRLTKTVEERSEEIQRN